MEVWKDIEGYEGIYQVSNTGRVRSLDRLNSIGQNRKGKILKEKVHTNGYHFVTLYKNKTRREKLIHRIVAETFLENKGNKRVVNHIDGVKTNNNVSNLEWATHKENSVHAVKTGLMKVGEQHHLSKLSDEEIRYIRENCIPRDKEFSQTALAKRFNISQNYISELLSDKYRAETSC